MSGIPLAGLSFSTDTITVIFDGSTEVVKAPDLLCDMAFAIVAQGLHNESMLFQAFVMTNAMTGNGGGYYMAPVPGVDGAVLIRVGNNVAELWPVSRIRCILMQLTGDEFPEVIKCAKEYLESMKETYANTTEIVDSVISEGAAASITDESIREFIEGGGGK